MLTQHLISIKLSLQHEVRHVAWRSLKIWLFLPRLLRQRSAFLGAAHFPSSEPNSKNQNPNPKTKEKKLVYTYMAYFRRMRPKTRLGGESLSANRTVEGPIFGPFHLGVVVAEVLLQVGQLDEGSSAIRQVTLVRPLSYKKGTVKRGNDFGDFSTFWEHFGAWNVTLDESGHKWDHDGENWNWKIWSESKRKRFFGNFGGFWDFFEKKILGAKCQFLWKNHK